MSQKDPEHIIDYINRKTYKDPKTEFWKYYKERSKRYPVDNSVFYCLSCKNVWSKVPKYIDFLEWRIYPKGNIPTYNKKRKNCPSCKKRRVNENTSKY